MNMKKACCCNEEFHCKIHEISLEKVRNLLGFYLNSKFTVQQNLVNVFPLISRMCTN